jgi:type VI secretion system secreted protein Hcp
MALDGFLKLDGIKGESRDVTHPDEIQILDVHFSMKYGAGGGIGKVDFHDISFTKRFDLSSPTLMGLCANGKHIKEGVATFRKAGEHPVEYLKIKMEDMIISSVTTSGLGSGDGMEHLTLNFSKIKMTYTPQNQRGTKGSAADFGWDVNANKQF